MNCVRGMKYHWLHELLQRMGLPILDGVEEVLKQANVNRSKQLEQRKAEAVKKKEELVEISTQGAGTRCPQEFRKISKDSTYPTRTRM